MKFLAATLSLSFLLSLFALGMANAAPAGKVIPKADLPAGVATIKKAAKFPGVPSCAKGRLETSDHDSEPLLTWRGEHQDHPCYDAATVYICTAFGKLSVRCEAQSK